MQAHALNNSADIAMDLYRERGSDKTSHLLEDATLFCQQSIALAEKMGSNRVVFLVTETFAHALEHQGKYEAALAFANKNLENLSGLGFIREQLDVRLRIGSILRNLQRYDDAIAMLSATRLEALKLDHYRNFGDLLRALSDTQEQVQDYKSALATYQEFHRFVLEQRDWRAQISAQIYAAKIDLEKAHREAEMHKNRVHQLEDSNVRS